jgi:hypothetical protein
VSRLDSLRGAVPAINHNARTIAALAANPGCGRRAVLDAAGIDKEKIAHHLGFPSPFGRSVFAIIREKAFEDLVKADECAHLLRLLRDKLGMSVSEVSYDDLGGVGGDATPEARHARTRDLLQRAAQDLDGGGTLFDHPLLKLATAGHDVYLEPDVIAFQIKGRFHIVEIKSFAIIDDQADAGQVSAAARQSAVYVHALRDLFTELGLDPERISHNVVLVCPENFANHPTATLVDVRQQLTVLRRQLSRLTRVDQIVDELPAGLTFDLAPDDEGTPTRPAGELASAVREVEARFAPECLSSCDMAFFCRAEARACDSADVLGRAARDELGSVESITTALGLADGALRPADEQTEIAAQLQFAHRLYAEALA